jgi:integrase
MASKRLTAQAVAKVKPKASRREIPDAVLPGLYLVVQPSGAKSWAVRYRFHGKPQKLTVGRYPAFELAKAREEAQAVLQEVEKGRDPKAAREQATTARRAAPETYRQAVNDYVDRYQIGQRGNATAEEVRRTLLREGGLRVTGRGDDRRERVVHPRWIKMPVGEVDARMIRRRLEEVRDGTDGEKPRPYLANRLHAYLGKFFAWAAEPGVEKVERSPMIGLAKPWDQEESRQRTFADGEIEALWQAADSLSVYRGAFLRMMILLGKRKGALAGIRWDEIDGDGVWTPKADGRRRTQNKRSHGVPLPARAQAILADLPRVHGNPHVFPGRHGGKPLDPGSPFQKAVQDASGVDDFFWHACRHTVETRLAELAIPPHVRDLVLDHAPARGAGAGYDHYQYRQEMRDALEAWSRCVGRILGEQPDNVTPIEEARRA